MNNVQLPIKSLYEYSTTGRLISGPQGITVTTPLGTGVIEAVILPPGISYATITSFTPDSGTNGTVITVTGTYFQGVTSVTIGGIPQAFTNPSSTEVLITVGPDASGIIVIITYYGTIASATPLLIHQLLLLIILLFRPPQLSLHLLHQLDKLVPDLQ